jgi:putative ABC transport system permease protein
MTKALFRDTLRAIRKTLSRFISIVIIVALGVGFFAGLKAVSPNMKAAARQFYDKHLLADIVVQSTVGFDEQDVAAVRGIPGVAGATLSRSVDGVFYKPDGKPEQSMSGTAYVTRVIG